MIMFVRYIRGDGRGSVEFFKGSAGYCVIVTLDGKEVLHQQHGKNQEAMQNAQWQASMLAEFGNCRPHEDERGYPREE